jgi:2-polyprenyl-3-methyl-5-hydroxy-6-metoxy-1,4-benzoquinol methylase
VADLLAQLGLAQPAMSTRITPADVLKMGAVDRAASAVESQVYVSICDTWVPRAVAERMLPLILEAAYARTTAKAAAEQIDNRLRADLGVEWTGDRATIQRGIRSVRTSKRARQAAQRLGPTVVGLIPDSLRPSLARIHRPLAQRLAAAKCRRNYGRGFVSEIHEEDDLLHYSLDVVSTEPAFRYYRAVQTYFAGGEWNASEVEKVLGDVGFSLGDASSFLEFACGYGRLTRHFVHSISPSKVTVSDIDRRAVDFVTEKLGVRGFYSAPTPEQLIHDDRYDVIVVVSLFSHLPIQQWAPWLKRMNEMLHPGGLLLFSVLGAHAWEVNVSDADQNAFQAMADGFRYKEQNETRGRLSTGDYGMAYVSEEYVERVVSENFAGELLMSCPQALNGFQDIYVLQSISDPD